MLSDRAFVLRWFSAEHGNRLLVVNLGDELGLELAAELLLARSGGVLDAAVVERDDPRHAGHGVVEACTQDGWRLPAANAPRLAAVQPT